MEEEMAEVWFSGKWLEHRSRGKACSATFTAEIGGF